MSIRTETEEEGEEEMGIKKTKKTQKNRLKPYENIKSGLQPEVISRFET